MDISFCIVTYHARDMLRDCLRSLQQNPPACAFEVVVIDNHSQDGVGEMLTQEFPQVIFLEENENAGYTRPMNRALRTTTGRYRVQLNADTLVQPGCFDQLYEFMQSHPLVGICTPRVLNLDGTLQKQCRRSAARPWDVISYFTGLSRLFPRSSFFSRYLQTFHPEDETHPVEAVSGSCMMIRQEVLQQIGYLDEQFFAYQEDTDFCVRAGQAGWQIYYVPQARIIHYGGQSGSAVHPYLGVYQWHRSYYLYYRKNLARGYFFLFNWLYYGLMGGKLLFALAVTFLRKEKIVGTPKPR